MDFAADGLQNCPIAPAKSRGHLWRKYALRAAGWVFIAIVICAATIGGLKVRYWTYQVFDPLRFVGDIQRGLFWGMNASGPEGYLNQYDKIAPELPDWQERTWVPWLDYSPLKLLVMRQWAMWLRTHHHVDPNTPYMEAWQRPYWFTSPILHFSIVLEGLSAVAAFLLTRLRVIRGSAGETHRHFHGVWQGLVAALLIWFNPDIISNAHAWPQWDSWLVPFYLFGLLLASLDWWFVAGMMIFVGANFKGQMLWVAPIFLIWPLVQGRVGAAARWLSGGLLAYGLIVSGWLLTYIAPDQLAAARARQVGVRVEDYPRTLFAMHRVFDVPAAIWIFTMLLVVAAVPWILRKWIPVTVSADQNSSRWRRALESRQARMVAAVAVIVLSVIWPCFLPGNWSTWYLGVIAGGAVAAGALLLPLRRRWYLLAAVTGGGLFACIPLFHGSAGWWDCGVRFGTIHWPYLSDGPTSNIPTIFMNDFGWPREAAETAFTLPGLDKNISEKQLFGAIAWLLVLLSGIAIGLQTKRNDRRALVAFATPWLVFFLFSTQMQERYLLWGGAAAACCIGESIGMAVLGFLLALASMSMEIKVLFGTGDGLDQFGRNVSALLPQICSPDVGHTCWRYLDPIQPDIAWGILVIAMVFMYVSWVPSRRRA
jgi:hypothetical protein